MLSYRLLHLGISFDFNDTVTFTTHWTNELYNMSTNDINQHLKRLIKVWDGGRNEDSTQNVHCEFHYMRATGFTYPIQKNIELSKGELDNTRALGLKLMQDTLGAIIPKVQYESNQIVKIMRPGASWDKKSSFEVIYNEDATIQSCEKIRFETYAIAAEQDVYLNFYDAIIGSLPVSGTEVEDRESFDPKLVTINDVDEGSLVRKCMGDFVLSKIGVYCSLW